MSTASLRRCQRRRALHSKPRISGIDHQVESIDLHTRVKLMQEFQFGRERESQHYARRAGPNDQQGDSALQRYRSAALGRHHRGSSRQSGSASMANVGNPALETLASTVRDKLNAVVDAL